MAARYLPCTGVEWNVLFRIEGRGQGMLDRTTYKCQNELVTETVTFATRTNHDTQRLNMSVERLIAEFLEYLEIQKGCSPLTIQRYRHYLRRFHSWLNQNSPATKPNQINLEHIRRYRLYLAHLRTHDGLLLKRVTQSYHIVALRAFLRYLVVQRDIPVLSPDKVELPKQSSRSIAFLNPEQIERLLKSPKISNNAGLRDRTILETLFSTGLRVSELVSLNRDQIDLERKEFGVEGKGNKIRVVFLSDTAAEWIERYLRTRKDSFRPLFIRYSGAVDTQKNGEKMRLTARSVERIVSRYARRSGLPIEATPHTLRHSFATDLLISGADIRSVQEMLGHESIRTTQVYTHVTNRHLKEVHKAFHSRNRQG
jgi:site-specific recombinase XerD